MGLVTFTVAICTHNHADHLAVTLSSLKSLNHPECAWELLIVDNASTDETPQLLLRDDWQVPGIDNRVVREAALGVANARNRAVCEARGEYVIFLDDDETPDSGWLRAFERTIRAERPDAAGGAIRVLFEGAARPSWLTDDLLPFLGQLDYGAEPKPLTERSTPIWTGNAAFRVTTLRTLGLFDAELGRRGGNRAGGEDVDMYRRLLAAGCDMRWVPGAVIHHRIRVSKLSKRFFLDLHREQGKLEGSKSRQGASRLPPLWLLVNLAKAVSKASASRLVNGSNHSLRREMNVSYFIGYLHGWFRGANLTADQ